MAHELSATLEGERVIVGGYLNGCIEGVDGENIVDMAMTFDLAIVDTFFENKVNHAVCDVQQWTK